jgi:hypothetical protein
MSGAKRAARPTRPKHPIRHARTQSSLRRLRKLICVFLSLVSPSIRRSRPPARCSVACGRLGGLVAAADDQQFPGWARRSTVAGSCAGGCRARVVRRGWLKFVTLVLPGMKLGSECLRRGPVNQLYKRNQRHARPRTTEVAATLVPRDESETARGPQRPIAVIPSREISSRLARAGIRN